MIEIIHLTNKNFQGILEAFKPKLQYTDLVGVIKAGILDSRIDSYAMVKDDSEVICLVGLAHVRLGVAEAWVIQGILIDKYPRGFFKSIKQLIDIGFRHMGLHRMEIAVDVDWKSGDKWAKTLGFEFEGICRAYDISMKDHKIFSKIVRR